MAKPKKRRKPKTTTSRLIVEAEERLIEIGWERTPRRVASRLGKLIGINPYTWRRWRNGEFEAHITNWFRVQAVLAKIEEQARNGKMVAPPGYRKAKRTRRPRSVASGHKCGNRLFS